MQLSPPRYSTSCNSICKSIEIPALSLPLIIHCIQYLIRPSLGIPIRFVLSSAAQMFANLMITTFMSAHLLEFVLVVTVGPAAPGHPATPLIHCRCSDKHIDIPICCSFVLCVYLNIYFSTCLPAHTRRKFKGRTHTVSQAIAHTATPLSTHIHTHPHTDTLLLKQLKRDTH